jgi:MFS family permease
VTDVTWRWVFFVNLPIGAAALVFGLLFLREQPGEPASAFDLKGFVLAGGGLGLLMYGLSEGPVKGWHAPDVIVTCVVGAVLLAGLVFVELRQDQPLVALRLYGNRLFRSTNLAMLCAAAGFLGVLYLVALFFQDGLGMSALGSGLSTFPEALGVMMGAQVVTRLLYPNFGPRRVMMAGLTGVAAGMSLMALVGDHTSLWLVRLIMLGMGVAMSGIFIPSQAAAFASISPADTSRASSLFNAQRQLGGAVGVAILTTVLAGVGVTHDVACHLAPNLTAYHIAFLAAAGLSLLGIAAAATVHDADASATIVKRKAKAPAEARVADTGAEPAAV